VHFLKFRFTPDEVEMFASGPVHVVVNHPEYDQDVLLTPEQHAGALSAAGLDDGTIGFVVGLDGDIRDGLLAETSGDLSRLIGHPTEPLVDGLSSAR